MRPTLFEAETRYLPENWTCQTPCTPVTRSLTNEPSRMSHILSVPSLPLTILVSSCWKQVMAPAWAESVCLHVRPLASQTLIVESAAAETR